MKNEFISSLVSAEVISIAAHAETTTLFIGEGKHSSVTALLSAADRHPQITMLSGDIDEFWDEDYAMIRPYEVIDGVLHVPVKGFLLNNFPFSYFGYLTGYEYIARAIERGLADPQVTGIALIVDSPGGYVSGCFELADFIYESRGVKPIHAFAYESAASAAYAIASSADTISLSTTAHVGSIGVMMRHVEYSAMNERIGRKVTYIRWGADKTAGNSDEELDKGILAHWQEEVDTLGKMFATHVARNRGITEQAVIDTRARTFMGQKAIDAGLADNVGLLINTLMIFEDTNDEWSDDMTTKPNTTPAVTEASNTAAVDAARAEGHAAGLIAGATAERERITAITSSDAAKLRPAAARSLAMKTTLSAVEIDALLADMAVEATAAAPATTEDQPLAADPKTNQQFTAAVEEAEVPVAASPAKPAASTTAEEDATEVGELLALTGKRKKREVPA